MVEPGPDEIIRLQRRIERERRAREDAEAIAERATRDLFLKNQALEGQQRLARALLERAEDAFFVLDVNGRILDGNDRATDLLVCPHELLLMSRVQDYWHNLPTHVQQGNLGDLCASGGLDFLCNLRSTKGCMIPVRIVMEAYHHDDEKLLLCTVQDRTEVMAAHAERQRIEVRARQIVDSMLDALVSFRSEGQVISANPAARDLFGIHPGRTGKFVIGQFVPALANGDFNDLIGRVREERAHRSNGEVFPIDLALSRLDADDGTYLAVIRDISERKELDRLKDQFVSTISHELRTPIASVRGALGLISSGIFGELDGEALDAVNLAERNSLRLVTLINDLLDHQRLASGHLECEMRAVPIQSVLDSACETVQDFAQSHGITLRAGRSHASVQADDQRLHQVLVNLLSNAVKFSARGTEVRLGVTATPTLVCVYVLDRGRGIPATALPKLFQPFSQVDASDAREKGGTGLGLAICRGIMEQHGATIQVASTPGRGSRFWFVLGRSDRQNCV